MPIGPAFHVVRLSGLGFSQTPVWSAHAAHVRTLAGGWWCSFSVCPAERRDFASENESLGRQWYAVASETRVASEMKAPWIVKGGNKIKGEK